MNPITYYKKHVEKQTYDQNRILLLFIEKYNEFIFNIKNNNNGRIEGNIPYINININLTYEHLNNIYFCHNSKVPIYIDSIETLQRYLKNTCAYECSCVKDFPRYSKSHIIKNIIQLEQPYNYLYFISIVNSFYEVSLIREFMRRPMLIKYKFYTNSKNKNKEYDEIIIKCGKYYKTRYLRYYSGAKINTCQWYNFHSIPHSPYAFI